MESFVPNFGWLRQNGCQTVYQFMVGEVTPEQVARGEVAEVTHEDPNYDTSSRMLEKDVREEMYRADPIRSYS
jgi:hypothetical protein